MNLPTIGAHRASLLDPIGSRRRLIADLQDDPYLNEAASGRTGIEPLDKQPLAEAMSFNMSVDPALIVDQDTGQWADGHKDYLKNCCVAAPELPPSYALAYAAGTHQPAHTLRGSMAVQWTRRIYCRHCKAGNGSITSPRNDSQLVTVTITYPCSPEAHQRPAKARISGKERAALVVTSLGPIMLRRESLHGLSSDAYAAGNRDGVVGYNASYHMAAERRQQGRRHTGSAW